MSVLLLYVPVIHQGYLQLLNRHSQADKIYILGQDLIDEFTSLHAEIRALNPELIRRMLERSGLVRCPVEVIDRTVLRTLPRQQVIVANDELSRKLASKYLINHVVTYDSAFLRWDEFLVNSSAYPANVPMSDDPFDVAMMEKAQAESSKSSDHWRQVGGVVTREHEILLVGHNKHVPSEHLPYIDGDPRDFIPAGTNSELSTALHCEQLIISTAARDGISLKGCTIHLTVFPCPACAKIIAYSGFRRCCFGGGHASLDGERVLRNAGVELVYVPVNKESPAD